MILLSLAIDAALIALFGWTMVLLHYVLFDRLARRRRARWERDADNPITEEAAAQDEAEARAAKAVKL